jgi:hypothetical protein
VCKPVTVRAIGPPFSRRNIFHALFTRSAGLLNKQVNVPSDVDYDHSRLGEEIEDDRRNKRQHGRPHQE